MSIKFKPFHIISNAKGATHWSRFAKTFFMSNSLCAINFIKLFLAIMTIQQVYSSYFSLQIVFTQGIIYARLKVFIKNKYLFVQSLACSYYLNLIYINYLINSVT